ncbi:hypothetical protein DL89DRAFT_254874 [Linderina pennispora]|uniref:Uncharacterized protein n=1 Tax=Linderina pennispora TaxID=61395 RepID=A0A1Y1WGM2_9FUNG|nr:uncharacterized protein DL89DRAFT_254874 [Linderina pennispora]ORX72683.1 hypothetical protein DL89DRAFT_254874 [Linderina pennispora]
MAGATQKPKRTTKAPTAIKQASTLALGGNSIDDTFIAKGGDESGLAMSDADLQDAGAGGFTFDSPVGGGGSSPAWSMSSGSNHGSFSAADPLATSSTGWGPQEPMFPSTVDNSVAGTTTAADAMLDGWLQQFVNTEAMDGNSKSRAQPTGDDASAEWRIATAAVAGSGGQCGHKPAVVFTGRAEHGYPRSVDGCGYCQCVAGHAGVNAVVGSSPMWRQLRQPGGRNVGPSYEHNHKQAAWAQSLITPMANIAPQKTLSVSESPSTIATPPPAKKQRRPTAPPKAAGITEAAQAVRGSTPATAVASSGSNASSPRPRSVSGGSNGSNGSNSSSASQRLIAPLAPRQQPQVQSASGQPRSGSNTPPGLSVLAKMAQKQAPMQVADPDHGLRPIAQAHAPQARRPSIAPMAAAPAKQAGGSADPAAQKRQERLIKKPCGGTAEPQAQARVLDQARVRAASSKKKSAGQVAGQRSDSQAAASKPSDAMQVDEEFVGGSLLSSIAPVLPASLKPGAPSAQNSLRQAAAAKAAANAVPRTIRPRVSLPVNAPKTQQQQQQQQQQQAGSTELSVQPAVAKPRAMGAVLMAMLFSFSLFTLPSLYTSDNSLTAGGSQSAGILPATESRLLISGAKQRNESEASGEPPLIERVRRSISAMTQQVDGGSPSANNSSASEPAGSPASSLSVVSQQRPAESGKPLDYAMMFCQNVQHVLFAGDADPSAMRGFESQQQYRPASARVLRATYPAATQEVSEQGIVQHYGDRSLEEDSNVVGLAGSGKELVPTLAAAGAQKRPRMSFYSPVVAGDAVEDDHHSAILPPWEEYAKMAAPMDGAKQKYLRIDVEVVGSRWVTADKFANGLF